MSKDNNTAGKEKDEQEEFVMVEVDEQNRPLNGSGAEAAGHDSEDDDEDGEEVEEEEERLGHAEDEDEGRRNESPDQKRDRRRKENRAKRIRNRVASEAKDRLLENQGRMLLGLQEQVAKLQGRSIQYDVNLLHSQLSQIEAQQSDAKAVMAKLVKANDGEGVAEITEMQMNLRDQHRQISEQLRRAKGAGSKRGTDPEAADDDVPAQQPRTSRTPAPDPEVVRRAQSWADKYKWANPRSGDREEIEIIKAIDHTLYSEGFNPRSDDYWDELTERVKRRLPHHFKKAAPNGGGNGGRGMNGDSGSRPAQGGPRMAPSSQSGAGSRPLGKNEVKVTPDRKAAMIAAGKWDDPVKRNRMLAEYARYDRENAGQQ